MVLDDYLRLKKLFAARLATVSTGQGEGDKSSVTEVGLEEKPLSSLHLVFFTATQSDWTVLLIPSLMFWWCTFSLLLLHVWNHEAEVHDSELLLFLNHCKTSNTRFVKILTFLLDTWCIYSLRCTPDLLELCLSFDPSLNLFHTCLFLLFTFIQMKWFLLLHFQTYLCTQLVKKRKYMLFICYKWEYKKKLILQCHCKLYRDEDKMESTPLLFLKDIRIDHQQVWATQKDLVLAVCVFKA